MDIGNPHYVSSGVVSLTTTGAKAHCLAPPFKTRLAGLTIYFSSVNASSPAINFVVKKYRNGTASNVHTPVAIASGDITTGKVLHYRFAGLNAPTGYIGASSADSLDVLPGDVLEFNVTSVGGTLTTVDAYVTFQLVE